MTFSTELRVEIPPAITNTLQYFSGCHTTANSWLQKIGSFLGQDPQTHQTREKSFTIPKCLDQEGKRILFAQSSSGTGPMCCSNTHPSVHWVCPDPVWRGWPPCSGQPQSSMAGWRSSQATSHDGKVPGQANCFCCAPLFQQSHWASTYHLFPSTVAHLYKKDYEPFKQEPESNLMNKNFLCYQKEDDNSALVAILFYNENVLWPHGGTQTPWRSPASHGFRLDHQGTAGTVRGQISLTRYIIEPQNFLFPFLLLKVQFGIITTLNTWQNATSLIIK